MALRRRSPAQAPRYNAQSGTTVAEICVVVLIIVTLFAIAIPRLRGAADRASARSAIQETSSLFSLARRAAVERRILVAVVIDSTHGAVIARAGTVVVQFRGLGAQYGVRISASRDSMSYDPRGLGYGAANLTVIARRGSAAETLTVSRFGRTRH